MNLDFELILAWAVLISGGIWLVDALFFARKRTKKHPLLVEYARSFFPILLAVLLLRSFIVEPFRIPSGSLKPTLLVGDFILVNKFDYGIRLPVFHKKVFQLGEPKKGDVVVFRYPPNPKIDYIKRIVGVPGDKISYINKVLYINGQPMPQEFVGFRAETDDSGSITKVQEKLEKLNSHPHKIYIRDDRFNQDFTDLEVPQGQYFAMGDNRDDSSDSRHWGFVPEKNIVGKAFAVWMSWNGQTNNVRWNRIATKVK